MTLGTVVSSRGRPARHLGNTFFPRRGLIQGAGCLSLDVAYRGQSRFWPD